MEIIEATIEKQIQNLEKVFDFLAVKQEIMSIEALRNYYNRIGLGKIILNPANGETAKAFFYKAGKSQLLFLKLYKGVYTQYSFDFVPSFVATTYYGIIPVLLSGNAQLVTDFTDELIRLPNENYTDKEDIAICYALKYLLLNDIEKASEFLGAHYLTAKKLCKYVGLVIAGIIKNDIKLIQKGIDKEIERHKKVNKESMFYSISQEATAWVKLAQKFNFEPDISSNFISKELLKSDDNLQYEDIFEVYRILGIE